MTLTPTHPPPIHVPSHPPVLTSLPQELLRTITLELDTSSALALGLAINSLYPIAEHGIWQELVLQAVSPCPGHDHWADTQRCKYCSDRRGNRLLRGQLGGKVDGILKKGSEARWAMVRSIVMSPRPGSVYDLTHLLRHVSPYLRSLVVTAPPESDDQAYEARESIDVRLLEYSRELEARNVQLSFPYLTNIKIGLNTVQFAEFVDVLRNIAPNLTSLDFAIEACRDAKVGLHSSNLGFPDPNLHFTHLRRLHIHYCSYEDFGVHDPIRYIKGLIGDSPELQVLYLAYGGEMQCLDSSIFRYIHGLDKLRELFLADEFRHVPSREGIRGSLVDSDMEESDGEEEAQNMQKGKISLPQSLKKLVMPYGSWLHSTKYNPHLPCAPGLTSLCLLNHNWSYAGPIVLSSDLAAQRINPGFTRWLRAAPALDTIRVTCAATFHAAAKNTDVHSLSGIDLDSPTGTVWSYRHRGQEVLHLRLQAADVEVTVYAGSAKASPPPTHHIRILHTTKSNSYLDRVDLLVETHDLVWVDYTSYDGSAVPLAVLEGMRKAEGVCEEAWQKRGVEVGEAAWQVLLDWQEESA